MKRVVVAVLAALMLVVPGMADAKIKFDRDFHFQPGSPARIIVFRPDVQVGSMGAGGIEEANADWTATAREKLAEQIHANQVAGGNDVVFLPDQQGDDAQVVADYQALFRTVASTLVQHKMNPLAGLPTKKDKFDWTLGPGAAQLGRIGGGQYGLFLSTHDAYGTAGRKAMQIFGALLGVAIKPGIHESYAALVDLSTGNIVWFNVDPGSGGDVRTDEGATKRVGQLLNQFPSRNPPAATQVTAK